MMGSASMPCQRNDDTHAGANRKSTDTSDSSKAKGEEGIYTSHISFTRPSHHQHEREEKIVAVTTTMTAFTSHDEL